MIRLIRLLVVIILGVSAVTILVFGVTAIGSKVSAATSVELHVCPSGCDYSDIQAALDAANPGDTIKVATGVYTALHTLASPPGYVGTSVVTQVAYIDKSISLLGGFSISDWEHQDPLANPTTLDADGKGRVIFITGEIQPEVAGFSLTGGNPLGSGGANTYDAGGGIFVITSTVEIHDNQIYSNTSPDTGGGIALYRAHGIIRGNSIHDNNTLAVGDGGGIFAGQSQLTITSNDIQSNHLEKGEGGGVALENSPVTLTQNTLSYNTADVGGGIYVFNGYGVVIIGNTITHNNSFGAGGIGQDLGQSVIRDNLISDNHASGGSGGGLDVGMGAAVLEGNMVISNSAQTVGGGISLYYSQATVRGNTIENNISQSFGGGVALDNGDNIFINNQVLNNAALNAGGGGLWVNTCGSADKFSHNLIRANDALGGDGGGIRTHNCNNAIFADNHIEQNFTVSAGAGIFFDGTNQLTLSRNIIDGNIASIYGGGIYGTVSGDWINNVIVGNSAPNGGSGAYLWASHIDLLHNTISGNVGGDKTGMVLALPGGEASTVNITDTIVVSQTTGILAVTDNQVNINGVLWFNNIANTGGQGTVISSNVTIGDPLFQPDGYHLQAGSNAIDKGIDSGIHIDIDGQPRPYQMYDLGADEFWPLDFLKNTFLPFLSR